MTYCFTCRMNALGGKKEQCKEKSHDLDFENLWDNMVERKDQRSAENGGGRGDSNEKLLLFLKRKIKNIVVSSNDSNRVFGIVTVEDHQETIEFGTNHAISWLKATFYNESKKLFSDETYSRALDLIKAKATYNKKIKRGPIYKRIAVSDDQIYYDLGREDWKIVKITKEAISLVRYDEAVPVFTRSNNQTSQPEPNLKFDGNPLNEFCKLLRICNPVFQVHVVTLFIEHIPIPLIVILGQQGSIKSTQGGLIKRLVDPVGNNIEDNLSHLSKNTDDLNVHLSNNYLVSFDNVSYISDETSDTFCKAITGAVYAKRKLYTNDEEVNLRYRRKIILNGISFSLDKGDLVERSITYNTDKIPENERKTVQEVDKMFERLLPRLLGQIFTVLQKSLQMYDGVKQKSSHLPRMADFAIWGESINQALGHKEGDFLSKYKIEMEQSNEILNENNPLLLFIGDRLSAKDEMAVPVSKFFQDFKKYAEAHQYDTNSSGFPKYSNKVRGFITRSKPLLDNSGFRIEFFKNTSEGTGYTKNQTMIKTRKISSPSSLLQ